VGDELGAGDQQSGQQDLLTSSTHTRPRKVGGLKEVVRAASRMYSVRVAVCIVVSVCARNRRDINMGSRFASASPYETELTGHPV
jgi:hypothetical protein